MKPAQQLLEELYDVVGHQGIEPKTASESALIDPSSDSLSECGIVDDPLACGGDVGDAARGNKSRLVSMLDEVLPTKQNNPSLFP